MRILQVIHGYPPHYMAGSEVYTYNLTNELAKHAEIAVFTRIENPYIPDYSVGDTNESGVFIRRINKPSRDYTFSDKYLDERIDAAFRDMMQTFRPDIVHIGHLSHLSTNIPVIAHEEFGTPVVFTAHDFWMGCYRGQLMDHERKICGGPSEEGCYSCAKHTYKEWIKPEEIEAYFAHMKRVMQHIDLYLAPSQTLIDFLKRKGVPATNILLSPYGFNRQIIQNNLHHRSAKVRSVRFGYMGRIIPVKGIDLLIHSFRQVQGNAELSIFGNAGNHALYLEECRRGDKRITFRGAFDNSRLSEVLNKMDVLVVPSIWLENSPLVIQEAHLAGIPVITSNAGGMAELVRDGVDGFLFPLGDQVALRDLLQKIVDSPEVLDKMSVDPLRIRSIEDDAQGCMAAYRKLLSPERITFVTNPGLCNLSCRMCDTHSPLNKHRHQLNALSLMDFSLIEQTIRELAPIGLKEVIPSTMGEPLLYPAFCKLLDLAAECNVSVNLTTNATFPCGGVDFWAERLLPVLSDVKFSLNAINHEVNEHIMIGADTTKQLLNIEKFLKVRDAYASKTGRRCTVTIQVTFMRSNVEHVPEILRWAILHGVDRLKGHHLWVTWPELEEESLKRSDTLTRQWNTIVTDLRKIAETQLLPSGKHICLVNVTPLHLDQPTESTGACPFIGKEAWIDADGSFHVCCCPSEVRKSFGAFGSLASDSLRRLWSSFRYRSFVSTWGDHENCKICNMRKQEEREIQDA